MPMHSKFISIDGTDGCGKATQVKMLVERLISENYPVEMSDFPQYGTKSAEVEEYSERQIRPSWSPRVFDLLRRRPVRRFFQDPRVAEPGQSRRFKPLCYGERRPSRRKDRRQRKQDRIFQMVERS